MLVMRNLDGGRRGNYSLRRRIRNIVLELKGGGLGGVPPGFEPVSRVWTCFIVAIS
jgi:hypothetical protein